MNINEYDHTLLAIGQSGKKTRRSSLTFCTGNSKLCDPTKAPFLKAITASSAELTIIAFLSDPGVPGPIYGFESLSLSERPF